ncbi:MAG: amino acid ABC transporter substrate-binding protein, partial [Cyanobacteria bacterium P01_E01_bin.34]
EGLVVPVPLHPEMDVVGVDEFATAAATLWGGEVNWRTALSYDAMQAFAQTLASGADSRDDIAVAFSDPGFEVHCVTGQVSFLSTGDRDSSLMLVQVVDTTDESSSRSGVGLDFAPINEN